MLTNLSVHDFFHSFFNIILHITFERVCNLLSNFILKIKNGGKDYERNV